MSAEIERMHRLMRIQGDVAKVQSLITLAQGLAPGLAYMSRGVVCGILAPLEMERDRLYSERDTLMEETRKADNPR